MRPDRFEPRCAPWAQRAQVFHDYPAHFRAHFEAKRRGRLRTYMGARLHRKLFASFLLAMLMAGVAATLTMRFAGEAPSSWRSEQVRLTRFLSSRFSPVWKSPTERDELARSLAKDLELGVRLRDARGEILLSERYPSRCRWQLEARVREGAAEHGAAMGTVDVCGDRARPPFSRSFVVMAVVVAVLWLAAGKVALRLARPLVELTRVARRIGEGDLGVRADLRCAGVTHDEVGELSDAVYEMAARIERQLREQRELLAAVSHELRTPLARVRLLLEYARDGLKAGPSGRDPLDEIDAEVVEMDALVGDLLATARVDFSALSLRDLDARLSAERAVERAGLERSCVQVDGEPGSVRADATLLARALAALLDNAKKYGGGATTVRVRDLGDRVAFEVEDEGRGFVPGDEARAFESFVRGQNARDAEAPGVGLGLALVRRIAEAHGGRAWACNRSALEGAEVDTRGARVTLELPRGGPTARVEP